MSIESHPVMMQLENFIQLYYHLNGVVKSEASWESKYDVTFNIIAPKLKLTRLMPDDYYIPDGSYQDDVMAFHRAVKERASDLMRIRSEVKGWVSPKENMES